MDELHIVCESYLSRAVLKENIIDPDKYVNLKLVVN